MRKCASVFAWLILASAVAHASFYGAIRFSNDGIPGSGVSLSTSLIDFFPPPGPPNGQAVVQLVAGPDLGPGVGTAVSVKDFTPGSFVTDFVTFANMLPGPGYSGVSVSPIWPVWDPLNQVGPPYFFSNIYPPSGCIPDPFPFCVADYPLGGSIVFFGLRGANSNQLGFWQAIFGAQIPSSSSAAVRAALEGGQTVVSPIWFGDVATGPEPSTFTTLAISVGLLLVGRNRFRSLRRP